MKKSGKLFSLILLFLILFFSLFSLVSAGELKVTEEHPFLVNGSWISAKDLQVGDILQTADGKKVRITSLEDIVSPSNFSVYNLEAGIYHDFVVNGGDDLGVVVHNSNIFFSLTDGDTVVITSGSLLKTKFGKLKAYFFNKKQLPGDLSIFKQIPESTIYPESTSFINSILIKMESEGIGMDYRYGSIQNLLELNPQIATLRVQARIRGNGEFFDHFLNDLIIDRGVKIRFVENLRAKTQAKGILLKNPSDPLRKGSIILLDKDIDSLELLKTFPEEVIHSTPLAETCFGGVCPNYRPTAVHYDLKRGIFRTNNGFDPDSLDLGLSIDANKAMLDEVNAELLSRYISGEGIPKDVSDLYKIVSDKVEKYTSYSFSYKGGMYHTWSSNPSISRIDPNLALNMIPK